MERSLFAIAMLLVIDLAWITLNSGMYNELVRSVQGKDMRVNRLGAFIAYPLMLVGLVYVVLRNADRDESKNPVVLALRYGALFGLIVYGVFNATNIAMFTNYSKTTAIIDTLWGTFAYFLVTLVVFVVWKKR